MQETQYTEEQLEILGDFAETVHDIENVRKECFDGGYHDIGHKLSGVIQAFKAFTEEEVIIMGALI